MSVIGVFLLLSCCGFLFVCCLPFYLLALSVMIMGRGGGISFCLEVCYLCLGCMLYFFPYVLGYFMIPCFISLCDFRSLLILN